MAQDQEELFLQEAVDPAEYTTPAFSQDFKDIYGEPISYPRAWQRLMAVVVNQELVPHYKRDFLYIAEKLNFLDFCKKSDQQASQRKQRLLGRRELEGAWIQELITKYDQMSTADLESMIGRPWVSSLKDALVARKFLLEKAVEKVSPDLRPRVAI